MEVRRQKLKSILVILIHLSLVNDRYDTTDPVIRSAW